jgi:hypothetical protein
MRWRLGLLPALQALGMLAWLLGPAALAWLFGQAALAWLPGQLAGPGAQVYASAKRRLPGCSVKRRWLGYSGK